MTKEQLIEIIKDNDEKEYIEFKANYLLRGHEDEIGEYISALSNSATLHYKDSAYMIFGVENATRNIIGTDLNYEADVSKDNESIKHYLSRFLSPSIMFVFEDFVIDDKRVVCLTIPKAIGVVTEYKRERYIRIGSSKELLKKYPEYEAELWKVLNHSDDICELASYSQDLTFAHLKNYLISKGNHINEETFYKNYNLLNSSGKFNRMAELLADENDIIVNVMIFKGKDKTEYSRRNEFGYTCLLLAYERVKNYVFSINDTFIDTSVRPRREKKMFNFDAFNEAWVNACVHNEWAESNHPGVYIYEDRLVVESQGGIPKSLTKKEFLKGVSHPVNKKLMDIFIKCEMCEESGHGVPKVVGAYGEDAYEFMNHFIDVTIPFDKIGFSGKNTTEEITNTTTKTTTKTTKKKIVELLKNNPYLSKSDLAFYLKISEDGIQYHLNDLKNKGIIKRIGANKGGHWEVKEDE